VRQCCNTVGTELCNSHVTYRLVPQGTYKVQAMLQQGGWGCAQGGYTGTFTPMWLMVARKPLR
jgi:hypothetical protein